MSVVFGKVPVLADADRAVLKFEQMPRRKLMNAGEGGNGIGDVSVIKIFEQALGVDFSEFGGDGEDRFDLGSEVEISLVECIVKRLLATPPQPRKDMPRKRPSPLKPKRKKRKPKGGLIKR